MSTLLKWTSTTVSLGLGLTKEGPPSVRGKSLRVLPKVVDHIEIIYQNFCDFSLIALGAEIQPPKVGPKIAQKNGPNFVFIDFDQYKGLFWLI